MKRSANQTQSQFKPFKKRVFFLDLRSLPQLNARLTTNIKALGGRVDEFFNNKIKYLVTDRPKKEWPEKIINSKGLHNCIDSNDQFSNHSSISLPTTYAGVTSGNKGETLKSRGQLLLAKAGPSNAINQNNNLKKPNDVLELARKADIKILPAVDVLIFCEQYLNSQENKQVEFSPSSEKIVCQPYKLNHPFLKVEDKKKKFRPIYKEFLEWPEVNLESNSPNCPFSKRKNYSVVQPEGLGCIEPLNDDKKIRNTTLDSVKTTESKKKPPIKKQIVYCEICHKEYSNLEKHLKTGEHHNYVLDSQNFKSLLSVISSLPKFTSKEDNDYDRLESDDDSDSDIDEALLFAQFNCTTTSTTSTSTTSTSTTTTPTTTIQINTNKATSRFLPLHDLLVSPILAHHNKTLDKLNQSNRELAHDIDAVPSTDHESSDFSGNEFVADVIDKVMQSEDDNENIPDDNENILSDHENILNDHESILNDHENIPDDKSSSEMEILNWKY